MSRKRQVQQVVAGGCLLVVTALSAHAAPAYSPKVEAACRDDYFRFCPGYPLGSASLRLCMESKSKQLTQSCVSALIQAGEVDRRRIKRGY